MFNVVSSKKRHDFAKDMDQMYEGLKRVYGANSQDAYDHDYTMYILYSHKKFGVIGGARIIPAGSGAITQEFLDRIKIDPKTKVFELSRIFFDIPKDQGLKESEAMYEVIRRDFYQGLYEALKTISIAQKVKTFVSILSEEEHQVVQQYGMWPFDKQGKVVLPKMGKDPYILGYLPMSQPHYERFLDQRFEYEQKLRQGI